MYRSDKRDNQFQVSLSLMI